ncbi:MAG: TRAP transporter substrate-binding protein [Bacillota bacterium]
MKTKLLLLLLIFALVLVPVISGCAPADEPAPDPEPDPNGEPDEEPEEDAQSFTLQFATFWPGVDFQVEEGHKGWAKEISDRVAAETPHSVEFEWHYAGALLAATEIYTGVAQGAADLGSTCPIYTAGVFPVSQAFELPGFNNDNALVASVTIHEAWKQSELLQEEFKDVKIMHFWATGPGDFMTNTRIETMEDLAGLELRALAGSGSALALMGGVPVAFPMGQSYENIETGVVDGLIAPTDTLQGFRLAEVTQYITKTPFIYNILFMKVMNWDTWNSLPPSVQQIFDEVNEKYVIEYGKLRTDYTLIGEQFGVEEFGMEVIELAPDEYQRWVETSMPVVDQWIEATDDLGLPGQEIVDMVREFDARYSAEHGSYGN